MMFRDGASSKKTLEKVLLLLGQIIKFAILNINSLQARVPDFTPLKDKQRYLIPADMTLNARPKGI